MVPKVLTKAFDALYNYASFVGPGFLIAVAYIDPGNYATDVSSPFFDLLPLKFAFPWPARSMMAILLHYHPPLAFVRSPTFWSASSSLLFRLQGIAFIGGEQQSLPYKLCKLVTMIISSLIACKNRFKLARRRSIHYSSLSSSATCSPFSYKPLRSNLEASLA